MHGDCNVPHSWKDAAALGFWCGNQRQAYKAGTLSPERISRLEQLGFVWALGGVTWDEQYRKLVAYKKTQGDCNVTARWKGNPTLGHWCTTQRGAYKAGALSPDCVKRLENIGFVWDPLDAVWEEMFAALTGYKKENNDCRVPVHWKPNPKFGKWCATQRRAYKSGALTSDRVKRLENIGFPPYD